jgi:DNA modification methylase
MELFNEDCFNILPEIKEKTVDLVVVDLPYGQIACKWDCLIDLDKMWVELKRCCKRNCVYVFFCTTKFGYQLIKSNEKWFKYDIVWEKSRKVGFLSANKMPLRKHEMMYVFADANTDDLENTRNLGLRVYAEKVKNYINKPIKVIDKAVGNQGINHFYRFKSTQFGLPTEKTYNILIEKYNLREMPGFREYKSLTDEWEKHERKIVYNPQKTEGKPYQTKEENIECVYGSVLKHSTKNKGYRHPTSILKFNNPKKSVHRTQKPVELCEWLIKSYSNEGDIVLDFTMGSGSTGVACKNTNRKFIGIEKDEEIFKIAYERLTTR